MDIEDIIEYFWEYIKYKKPPPSVWAAIRRETQIEDLCIAGEKRIQLTALSNDELEKLHNQLLPSKFPELRPHPYVVSFCYRKIIEGINNQAVKFQATSNTFQISNEDSQLLYSESKVDDEEIFEFREALFWIGVADEILRPYICDFTWSTDATTIRFCWP